MDIWPVFYQLYLEANLAQVTISSSAKCATTPERDLSLRSISQLLYRLALLTLGTLAAPPHQILLSETCRQLNSTKSGRMETSKYSRGQAS
jgi:hypothetical protein